MKIGIDVGGTFTDFTVEDGAATRFHKVQSTPHDPSEAIATGLRDLFAAGARPAKVRWLGHGTTVATNIVVERRGARVGLLTTSGFRDVLELGRQARPSIYDYRVEKPPVLIPRDRRFEVVERMGADGSIVERLDAASLHEAVERLAAADVEAVAIVFLHAWRNPAHEAQAAEAVRLRLPDVPVSVSSELLPEFREFERASTTALNAYVAPKMARYFSGFATKVAALGVPAAPYVVNSAGGLMSVPDAAAAPVRTCVSGPAAGVVGAREIAGAMGLSHLVTFDVGGTSTDVALVVDGVAEEAPARLVAGYPVKTAMLDIHVIGAGGGSVAAVDGAGALTVGPRSAGADPGPAAYGRGGTEATLTDANLVLGRLPTQRLAGGLTVDPAAARAAVAREVAGPLGLDVSAAAEGIVAIAVAAMSRAIRSVSVERGHDLGAFVLVAYGGAGPLHAADVARECGIPQVLIPEEPGTLCARGMLLADPTLDLVQSCFAPADQRGWSACLDAFAAMTTEAERWFDREGVVPAQRNMRYTLDARYRGQNFEVRVDAAGLGPDALHAFVARFEAAHDAAYGYAVEGRAVELVTARLKASAALERPAPREVTGAATLADATLGEREAIAGGRALSALRIDRAKMPIGIALQGPACVEEMSATLWVPPGASAVRRANGSIVMEVGT